MHAQKANTLTMSRSFDLPSAPPAGRELHVTEDNASVFAMKLPHVTAGGEIYTCQLS